jgi:hypothetical protein
MRHPPRRVQQAAVQTGERLIEACTDSKQNALHTILGFAGPDARAPPDFTKLQSIRIFYTRD